MEDFYVLLSQPINRVGAYSVVNYRLGGDLDFKPCDGLDLCLAGRGDCLRMFSRFKSFNAANLRVRSVPGNQHIATDKLLIGTPCSSLRRRPR